MSKFIKQSIKDAIKISGMNITEYSVLESLIFLEKVQLKYSNSMNSFPLWDNLKQDFFIRDPNCWDCIDEFIQEKEFYLFFDKRDEAIVYVFTQGQLLVDFLNEFPPFVFYITNESLDYLICYNDHDYLIAAGTAEPWLRNKAIELSKTGWKDMDGFYWDENGVKKR